MAAPTIRTQTSLDPVITERIIKGFYRFDRVNATWAAADVTAVNMVAAPGAGKMIVVVGVFYNGDNTGSVELSSTDQTQNRLVIKSAFSSDRVAPFMPGGWFVCEANQALNIKPNTSGTAAAGELLVVYCVVPTTI